MNGFKPLNHHFQMIGMDKIRIRQEGYPLRTFTLKQLWDEYRKIGTSDPSRSYVIERAIETFEGKSPRDLVRVDRGTGRVSLVRRIRWAVPGLGKKPKKRKKFLGIF